MCDVEDGEGVTHKSESAKRDRDKTKRILTEKNDNQNGKIKMSGSNISLHSKSSSSPCERVKVIVRCRPLSNVELEQGHTDKVVTIDRKKNEIEIRRPNPTSTNLAHAKHNKLFTFDTVYDNEISQKELFDDAFRSVVDSVLEGFNGTIFAYGQTGTGKTYTMEGIRDEEEHHGVIPNAFKHIFQRISESPNKKYLVRASYLEIYKEEIRDLLYKDRIRKCELKESENKVYVSDLSNYLCANFDQINELMTRGNKNRSVGATNMNEHSSRSHAIFTITIEASEKWADGKSHFRIGKLNLVDLAGSERQGKSGAEGDRLKEAVKINLSLSALGNVIASLADGRSSHIPYRDSKLTRLLQDSLGGNSKTIMVATIGPAGYNFDETMTTLRYASRAKRIKNKPKVNEDPKDAMLREYQEEIAKLRAELAARKEQNPSLFVSDSSQSTGRAKTGKSRPTTAIPVESLKLLDDKHYQDLLPLLEQYGLGHTRDPKEIMELLENRKRELLRDNQTVREEKDRLWRKLEETQNRVKVAEEDCFKLYDRIDWLESKVLNGGKSLLDHTNEQQKLVEQRKRELEEQRIREEDIMKKIAEQELSTNEVKDIIANLDTEVGYKRNKLAKLSAKLDKLRLSVGNVQHEYNEKRAELDLCQLDIQKELKLKKLIIDNFIPPKTREILESHTTYNAEDESFTSADLSSIPVPRPPVNRMILTPVYSNPKEETLVAVPDLYYTDSNVIQLRPEPPLQLTKAKPVMEYDPQVASLLSRAFADIEKGLVIDCVRFNQPRIRRSTAKPRLGEAIPLDNQLVRQINTVKPLTATPGIKYRDYVVVTKINSSRSSKSAKRSPLQSASSYCPEYIPISARCPTAPPNPNPKPCSSLQKLPHNAFLPPMRPSTALPSSVCQRSTSDGHWGHKIPNSARQAKSPPEPSFRPMSARSPKYAVVTINHTKDPLISKSSFGQGNSGDPMARFTSRQLSPCSSGGFSVQHPLLTKEQQELEKLEDLYYSEFEYEVTPRRCNSARQKDEPIQFSSKEREESYANGCVNPLKYNSFAFPFRECDLPETFKYNANAGKTKNSDSIGNEESELDVPGLSQLSFLSGLFRNEG